uniref:Uncharacterized protein n=1 Tax=Aegilops tauschii subsp. strangulata TaxID=200361 RepID=A0A453FCZ9_AEGTS
GYPLAYGVLQPPKLPESPKKSCIILSGEADHEGFSGGGWGALVRRPDGNNHKQSTATSESASQEDLSNLLGWDCGNIPYLKL